MVHSPAYLSFSSPHQLLHVAAPAKQLGELSHCHLQVSQLHVVASAERRLLERPHGVPVEEEAWDCGAHCVDQAGTRFNLDRERRGGAERVVTLLAFQPSRIAMEGVTHLQGRAHDDEQVGLGEVFGVKEVFLREVLAEEHHVRFDRGGAERAHGNLVVHNGVL